MGQILIRGLDDTRLVRLKMLAKERQTSVEALAREAVHARADERSVEEKLAIVREMQARTRRAMIPGIAQTPGVELIREDRDR